MTKFNSDAKKHDSDSIYLKNTNSQAGDPKPRGCLTIWMISKNKSYQYIVP